MTYQTTEKHFKLFCNIASKWIEKFGLLDWEIKFEHSEENTDMDINIDDNTDISEGETLARTLNDVVNKWALFKLYVDWGDLKPTKEEIELVAIHEVYELLYAKLRWFARTEAVDADIVDEAIHSVIRTLENVFHRNGVK